MVSIKMDYKDLEQPKILSRDIIHVTRKGLGDRIQEKKVEMRVNIGN